MEEHWAPKRRAVVLVVERMGRAGAPTGQPVAALAVKLVLDAQAVTVIEAAGLEGARLVVCRAGSLLAENWMDPNRNALVAQPQRNGTA